MDQDELGPEYDAWVASCAKDCFCCDECGTDIPCAGVLAGGLCDRMCRCRDVDDDEFRDDCDSTESQPPSAERR